MKTKLFTLFLMLTISTGTVFSNAVRIGDLYYNLNSNASTAEVTSSPSSYVYNGNKSIPDTITYSSKKYIVSSIGNYAFEGCKVLTSVTIPNSVTSIGNKAFYECTGLTSVTIGNGVTSIGNQAFYLCTGLTSITIPNSVTSIGDGAFYGCSGLTSPIYNAHVFAYMPTSYTGSYSISEGIKSIAGYAFYGCSGLTSIEIPNSVTSIGNNAFTYCKGLTSVTIGNSVTSIGFSAFYDCAGLTSVTIPNSVTSIGNGAFYGCSGLTSIVVDSANTSYDSRNMCNALIETSTNTLLLGCKNAIIPDGILKIDDDAFYNCSDLTSIEIPNSVTSIGNSAFEGCAGLTSVTIPNSVTFIGDKVFKGCAGLTSVALSNSYLFLGSEVFYGCDGIKYLYWDVAKIYEDRSIFSQTLSPDTIIIGSHVTSQSFLSDFNKNYNLEFAEIDATLSDPSAFKNWAVKHIVWNAKSHGDIKYPSQVPFCNRENVETFVIGDRVEVIGDYLCSDLKTVTSLEIPERISQIGKHAFKGSTNITSVRWNAINSRTNDDIFKEFKKSITSFEMGDKVTHIPDSLCINMIMVDSIIIPQSVKQIGKAAFQNCKCITNIPNSVIEVGKCSFLGCSNLSTISSNLQFIGDSAFAGCSKLTDITFPSERLSIGSDAFLGCNIMNVYITDIAKWCSSRFPSAYKMGDYTQQIKLNGIMLFNKATKLYVNGKELHDLVIPDECSSVTGRAFESYAGLRSVTFHNGIRGIGEKSFDCPNLMKITCFATNPPSAEEMYVQKYYANLYTFYVEAFPNVKNKIKLYVPQNSIETYREAKVWQNFNTILPIQNALEINEDDVKATPTANNSVIVQWPSVEQADSYIVEIWKEEDLICSFTFDSQGYLLRVSNAVRAHYGASNHSAQADHISKGWQYTIDGLEPGMQYTYTISMKDSEGIDLFSQSLLFCTYGEGLEENKSRIKAHKILHNGQILILRREKIYTLQGQEMR